MYVWANQYDIQVQSHWIVYCVCSFFLFLIHEINLRLVFFCYRIPPSCLHYSYLYSKTRMTTMKRYWRKKERKKINEKAAFSLINVRLFLSRNETWSHLLLELLCKRWFLFKLLNVRSSLNFISFHFNSFNFITFQLSSHNSCLCKHKCWVDHMVNLLHSTPHSLFACMHVEIFERFARLYECKLRVRMRKCVCMYLKVVLSVCKCSVRAMRYIKDGGAHHYNERKQTSK